MQDCEFRWCSGAVYAGPASTVTGNSIHDMGQNGLKAWGNNIKINGNEIWNANWRHMNTDFEGGGTKFWMSDNLQCTNNYIHDIYGPCLWSDYGGVNLLVDQNTILNCGGITVEMTQSSIVSNNYVQNCSWDSQDPPWSGCGIFLYASPDSNIYSNTVVDNKGSICLQTRERGFLGRNVNPEDPNLNLLTWNQCDATDYDGSTTGFVASGCTIASDTPGWIGSGQRIDYDGGSKTNVPKTSNRVLRMTSTGGASMTVGTTPGLYGIPTATKIHEDIIHIATARVRGSSTPRSCQIKLIIYDAFGNVAATYTSTATSNSAEIQLSVQGNSTDKGVWASLQIVISGAASGESHWVDQLYIGTLANWQLTGGWVISYGQQRSGIYNVSIHNNDITYTEGLFGYTGLVVIYDDDYAPYANQIGDWGNAVSTSNLTATWYSNTYRPSDDPAFVITSGPNDMWQDPSARFLWNFLAGWEDDPSSIWNWVDPRYVSFSYWQNTLGKDAGSVLAPANGAPTPPPTHAPTSKPTLAPTKAPTPAPTPKPTPPPTKAPTPAPTTPKVLSPSDGQIICPKYWSLLFVFIFFMVF